MAENPLVSIVMGSDSDFSKMEKCISTLREFGVSVEARVVSAHRSPALAHEFATTAEERGVKVIIAAAGASAHLAGVMAALTPLPVIGVPMSGSPLGGVDALYSTVQMPPGIPVATVGVDAAQNAAILAVQILATADPKMREAIKQHKVKLAEGVVKKSAALQEKINKA